MTNDPAVEFFFLRMMVMLKYHAVGMILFHPYDQCVTAAKESAVAAGQLVTPQRCFYDHL